MNTITGFGKEERYLGQYQQLSATEIILWLQGQYHPSVNLTPYLHASQLEIVQPHRTPGELFLVAAIKPGYTFLSTCSGGLEAMSAPSFGSALSCAVQVLFVPVDERWQKRSCSPSVASSYRI